MKNTTVVAATGLLLIGGVAYAEYGDADHKKHEAEYFQRMKQEMLEELDAKINAMQKVRACVSAATDPAAIKRCHEEQEAAMKAHWESKKQEQYRRKLQMIEQQEQQLEREKQELQQKQKEDKK